MGEKGFTLIELLAVIVILAIIAVMSAPIFLGIIDTTKAEVFKASIQSLFKASELLVVTSETSSGNLESLKIKNNNFYGSWEYDSTNSKFYLCDISSDNYVLSSNNFLTAPSGKKNCISSDTSPNDYQPLKATNISNQPIDNVISNNFVDSELDAAGYIIDNDNSLSTDPNNYVWYSGRMWRAYKKDSDGIRLITSTPMTSLSYGTGTANSNLFSTSYAKAWLDNIFLPTLNGYNDVNFLKTVTWDTRKFDGSNYADGETVTSKIGMISVEEYKTIHDTSASITGYCDDSGFTTQTTCEDPSNGTCYSNTTGEVVSQYTTPATCENPVNGTCYNGTTGEVATEYSTQATCEDPSHAFCYSIYDGTPMPQYTNRLDCENNDGYFGFNWSVNYWDNNNWTSIYNNYLFNNTIGEQWTLTPLTSDSLKVYRAYYGNLSTVQTGSYNSETSMSGISPVIKIASDTEITDGNGTVSNPYRLLIDKTSYESNTLIDKNIGEYVDYSGYTWRVQSKIGGIIRLIMNGTVAYMKFDTVSTNTFNPTVSTNIGYYLNNDFYNNLDKSKIIDSIFYKGNYVSSGNYTSTNLAGTNLTAKVGIPRLSEIFSSQDMVKNNGTLNKLEYWLITPKANWGNVNWTSSTGGGIGSGSSYPTSSTKKNVRPIITITNSTITGGNGTALTPYTIE